MKVWRPDGDCHKELGEAMEQFSLQQLLADLNDDEFLWLADYYGILWRKGSGMRQRAITGISRNILQPDLLFDEAVMLTDQQWINFTNLADGPQELPDHGRPPAYLRPFFKAGYLYMQQYEGRRRMVMPTEIRKLLLSDAWEPLELLRVQMSELIISATAAVALYGAIELLEFNKLHNKLFGSDMDAETMFDLLLDFDVREISEFVFWHNYLVHTSLAEDDFKAVYRLLEKTREKPRYMPTSDNFVCYADAYYIKMHAPAKNMLAFLADELHVDILEAEVLLVELENLCRTGMRGGELQRAMDLMADSGVVFPTKDDTEKFANLLSNLMRNTRLWSHKGHTELEMQEIDRLAKELARKSRQTAHMRPGRNEPCPCGSGKMYRNCCGKHENIIKFPNQQS